MIRKLKLDSLRSEINETVALIEESEKYGDSLGVAQLEIKLKELEDKLSDIIKEDNPFANIAFFFGGKPVFGSKGINARFSASFLYHFQDLFAKVFSIVNEENLGQRGPIPNIDKSNLMVTEVTRGSFGFILEELSDQKQIFNTKSKEILERAIKIIQSTISENETDFEEILNEIDERTLISLRKIFDDLYKNDAVVRIVEDEKDFTIDEISIKRGKQRSEQTSIEEEPELLPGIIVGFLPHHKKFELLLESGEQIYGSVINEAIEKYNNLITSGKEVMNNKWNISILTRIIKPLNRPEKKVYNLIDFFEIND